MSEAMKVLFSGFLSTLQGLSLYPQEMWNVLMSLELRA